MFEVKRSLVTFTFIHVYHVYLWMFIIILQVSTYR